MSKQLNSIYTPMADFIVVEFKVPSKTKGGILLTDSAKEDYSKEMAWKVLAVGPQVKQVKINDYVLVGPHARPLGIPLIQKKDDEVQHVQVHEHEVLGVVDAAWLSEKKEFKPSL